MSQDAIEQVLGRLITDDAFRARARRGLLQASREAGYVLTTGEQALLARLNLQAFADLAECVDTGLRRG